MKKRDWEKMSLDAWENAGGTCESCGHQLSPGYAPAHLIPRQPWDETLDESWNLALLCIAPNQCHTLFDENRHLALFEDWFFIRASEDWRIAEHFLGRYHRAVAKGLII